MYDARKQKKGKLMQQTMNLLSRSTKEEKGKKQETMALQ
jgi:hypothetical protein